MTIPSVSRRRSRNDGVEVVLEGSELAVPVPGQGGQELLRHLHGGGAKPVAHPAPLPRFGSHQTCLGQKR